MSCTRLAVGVLLFCGGVTAGCAGKGSGKKDAAGDAVVSPDGPPGTGGAFVSQTGGTVGATVGTGGTSALGGSGGPATGGTTSGTGGTDVSEGGRGGNALGGRGGAANGGTTGGGGTSTGGTGTGCCGLGQPCPQGYSCAGNSDELFNRLGRCEPTPPSGSCYNDIDCPQDGLCRSAVTCPCDAECFAANQPGTCEAVGEACCHANEDCTAGQRCIGFGTFTKGRCMTAPGSTGCYTNGDCSTGRFCYLAQVCACGANCATQSGFCAIE